MRQKLSVVTLGVKNFRRSLEFYQNGLGWKVSRASGDEIAFFPMGGIVLALYPHDELAKDATVAPEGNGFSGFTLAYNAKSQEEVDEVLHSAQTVGATIVKPAQKVFWGGYSGYFADPDGYLWEVAWNPEWPFDENDNLVLP